MKTFFYPSRCRVSGKILQSLIIALIIFGGNYSSAIAQISLNGVPVDITIGCDDALPSPASVTASTNCCPPSGVDCFKIEGSELVDTTVNGVTFTFTYDSDNEPSTVTISGGGIISVTVKGGTVDSTYTGDLDGITAPINPNTGRPFAISNIVICVDVSSGNCLAGLVFTEVAGPGSCAQASVITRTWTAMDSCGNTATASQIITIADNTAPIAQCQDVTIQLDGNGAASIPVGQVDGGSSDNCSDVGDLTLAVDRMSFSCADVGVNPVVLSVTDECGNTGTCTAMVTVEDNIAPVITCPGDLEFDCMDDVPEGNASDAAATDNCAATISVSDTDNGGGGCAGSPLEITRTYTATDGGGNTASCTQKITVESDTLAGGNCSGCEASVTVYADCMNPGCVYVTSCKDLSNVVLVDCQGNVYKQEGFGSGDDSATVCHPSGLPVVTVYVKSGCYQSPDGPGYGYKFELCGVEVCPVSGLRLAGDSDAGGAISSYPNPFSGKTSVEFRVKEDTEVMVEVFDLTGQKVAELYNNSVYGGMVYAVDFDGSGLTDGMYIVRLSGANGIVENTRIFLERR